MPVRKAVAALLIVPLAMAGCSGDGEKPATQRTSAEKKPYTGPLAKEAWSSLGGGHSRIEMKQVERRGDRSVLRFYVTNPGKEPDHYSFATSVAGSAFANLHFTLVDPVGHKAYTPLYDDNGNGKTVGSDLFLLSAHPGVRYETVLHFPPLPQSLEHITVITPTTAGEFTGVPVVDGTGPIEPTAPAPGLSEQPKPGSLVSWPTRKQNGPAAGGTHELYGITDGEVKSTTTSGTEQKVGLRTDVLFAFDKATLSAQAKAILDQVAAETKAEADPAKPPILITGHTDGKGGDDYNMSLSQRRADAVLKELQARLGTAYRYKAEGRGETEPIAEEGGADDEKARQKNRRVEISYQIKQRTTETATTSSRKTQEHVGGTAGAPASFHPLDGRRVASRYASFGNGKRRIDVKPFYRDGAYLVAVFDIVNMGPATAPPPRTTTRALAAASSAPSPSPTRPRRTSTSASASARRIPALVSSTHAGPSSEPTPAPATAVSSTSPLPRPRSEASPSTQALSAGSRTSPSNDPPTTTRAMKPPRPGPKILSRRCR